MNNVRTARATRGAAALGALTCLSLLASPLAAYAAEDTPRWTTAVTTHDTGVNNGYQLAFDETNGKVYFTDAKWRSENKVFGSKESDPLDWSGVREDATSHSSMRTTFSPYGIAVDGKLDGGTIVTTTARQRDSAAGFGGGVVVYPASQGAPTDADRIFAFDDGTPVFAGVRRIAVDEQQHRAYVTNLGNSRGSGPEGFIAVLDLNERGAKSVLARVTIPDAVGAVGVAVDETNNLIYVGSMTGEKLYVIDGSKIDTSNPKDLTINDGAVRALDANVGVNARPSYDPELKRIYSSSFDNSAIAVVEADPESSEYGELIATIPTGPTNAVEIDAARGLLYSANLGDQEVVVFDANTFEELHRVPTSGNAVNLGVNDETGEVWVSNFAAAGKTDVFRLEKTTSTETPEAPAVPTDSGSFPGGATATYETEWAPGGTLRITGTDWKIADGSSGSGIAVKLNRGSIEPKAGIGGDVPGDVWAYVEADADGSFVLDLEFPTPENSNLAQPLAEGDTVQVNLLSGSLKPGDVSRGGVAFTPVVKTPAAVETPSTEEWTHSVTAYDTGVLNGYQLAYDDDNGKVYFTDAKWRSETRDAASGAITEVSEGAGKVVEFNAASKELVANHSFLDLRRIDGVENIIANPGTGKLVEFEAATGVLSKNHDFTGLTRQDGSGTDAEPLDWSGTSEGATSHSSMRTSFSPYGVAVDGELNGGTLITTTARQRDSEVGYGGGVVIYTASQGAPTDADRVFKFDDGTPVFSGVRRIAVNEKTHQAFVTNLGNSRGSGDDGFIAVLDLTKRGADSVVARVTVPDAVGAVGVDVDEANNLIYVGSMVGEKLYVIDGSKIDGSDPKNLQLNNGAIRELDAVVGENARPTYSPELKRVYSSSFDNKNIAVVDADPVSPNYGKLITNIPTGPTNAVAVDGKLGLLYSANLGDQQVVAFDTEKHEQQFSVPTSGNAVNLGIDPVTRNVWVSNFAASGKTDVISITDTRTEQPGGGTDTPGSETPGGITPDGGTDNNPGGKLEHTGSESLLMLGAVGGAIMLLGAAAFIMQRRMRREL